MLAYLLKSTLCMGILLLVYLFFLEKEKMHQFNRFYLLGSILFSLIIPLITITKQIPVLTEIPVTYFTTLENIHTEHSAISPMPINNSPANPIPFLPILYCLIAAILLGRFVRNLYKLSLTASKNRSVILDGARLILLKENIVSHTFLKNIFINEEGYTNLSIEKEILTHELAHVKQRHSFDIIFLELLQIIFWFNPLLTLYKRAIQLNHEFLADDAVLTTHPDVSAYQNLLLDKLSQPGHFQLASPFNFSITKKRLVMMTKEINQSRILVKKLVLLPFLVLAVLVFSSKIISAQENPSISKVNGIDLPATKEGASKELLDEYEAIIKKNMTKTKSGQEIIGRVTDSERNKLESIYKQMNRAQRDTANVRFIKNLATIKKAIPTQKQFDSWKDTGEYGIWIDDIKVKNEVLSKYKAEDFSYYSVSNLNYNETAKKNIMTKYGLHSMYSHQLNLMTNTYYEKYYKRHLSDPENIMMYRIRYDKNKNQSYLREVD